MEVSSIAEFNLLGLLILDDLEEVLRLDWIERRDQACTHGDLVRAFDLCILQLRCYHLNGSVVQVIGSTGFLRPYCDFSLVVILRGDFSVFWNTQIADLRI